MTFSGWCSAAILLLVAVTTGMAQGTGEPVGGDVVVFTNGDQLTGRLERQVKDQVVFKSVMAGEITIPVSKIKTLRTAGKFAVLLHGVPVEESRRVEPEQVEITGGELLKPHAVPAAPIPVSRVAYVIDAPTFEKNLVRSPGFFSGWVGSATLGATFVQATQHGGTLTAAVALSRQVPTLLYFRPRHRMIVNVEETYGTSTTPVIPQTTPPSPDAVVKTSIFHADAERDEYLSKRTYLLGSLSFDHNFAQGLDLQQIYGFGVGVTVVSNPEQQLDLKADVHYAKQTFFDGTSNQNLIGSSFAENYRRSLPRKIEINESLDVIPAWNDLRAYSANGTAGIVMPVLGRFSFSNTVTESFLNNPSPGYRKSSLTYSAGLAITLK